MRLRTKIESQHLRQLIGCRDTLFIVGSCFAENIGQWLKDSCFDVCLNPFGVLYNPASIASSLLFLLNNKRFASEEMVKASDGRFYSFAHHGKFSADSAEELVSVLNCNREMATEDFSRARHILVTYGSAWVYERDGEIVANCHKFPAKEFSRRIQTVEEIVEMWKPIIERCGNGEEFKHFIFTVSPIRHIKDGLHGNQLSKATLLLAIDELCRLFPDRVEYLPAYELLVDDLRDYRFYADDLVHPNTLAIEFVKDYFAENCLDKNCREFLHELEPLTRAAQHKPFYPDSPAYKLFAEETVRKLEVLKGKYLV